MSFADLSGGEHASRVRNHWWWRPGWHVGRRFFTWHLTFDDASELHTQVTRYQEALQGVEGVDLVPLRWLHLTMQGVGFADEVLADDLSRIVDAARRHLADVESFTITFGKAIVSDEAIVLPLADPRPVQLLRRKIRQAIGEVWGPENVPEDAMSFRPHVSVAYISRDGGAAPLVDVVHSVDIPPADAMIRYASLIELNRDHRMYEWITRETVQIHDVTI